MKVICLSKILKMIVMIGSCSIWEIHNGFKNIFFFIQVQCYDEKFSWQ